MSNIKIADLQPNQVEFTELSNLELGAIVGGGRFSRFIRRAAKKVGEAFLGAIGADNWGQAALIVAADIYSGSFGGGN